MEVNFEFDKNTGYLRMFFKPEKYIPISRISNWNWTSDRVIEDLDWAQQCKAGTFSGEDGEIDYCVGFEGSPGIIIVRNDDQAYLCDQYDGGNTIMTLDFDELIDLLTQMRDYLLSIGK